jgi:hypothetical protein
VRDFVQTVPIWRVVTKWLVSMASNTISGTSGFGAKAKSFSDRIGRRGRHGRPAAGRWLGQEFAVFSGPAIDLNLDIRRFIRKNAIELIVLPALAGGFYRPNA